VNIREKGSRNKVIPERGTPVKRQMETIFRVLSMRVSRKENLIS
jgi:hypothetical protein